MPEQKVDIEASRKVIAALTAEQEQAAIELARSAKARFGELWTDSREREFQRLATALLSLHGRLKERSTTSLEAQNATFRAELTEARRQLEIAREQASYWKSEVDDFRMAHQWRKRKDEDTGTSDDNLPQEFADAARRALSQITPTETQSVPAIASVEGKEKP